MFVKIPFRSWDEFRSKWSKRIADEQASEFRKRNKKPVKYNPPTRLLFRGQSDARHPLDSSFDRNMKKRKVTGDVTSRYRSYIQEFRQARSDAGISDSDLPRILQGVPPEMVEEFVAAAMGQHHGLPTRLLDWSKSPYISAFFAFLGANGAKAEVAIWCLDVVEAQAAFRSTDLLICDSIIRINSRQIAQQGAFTLNMTKHQNLEDIFLYDGPYTTNPASVPVLFKMTLPSSEREAVLQDLDLMRINDLSLFNGDSGVIRHLQRRLNDGEFDA